MRASKASRCGVCLGPLLASCIVLTSPGVSQTIPSVGADISATMERLAIKLPMEIAGSEPIRKPLEELSRERCDQKAIATLGTELDKAGYRREAANAYVSYSETCGGYAPSLRSAVIVLLRLTDYTRAATVASDLIKLQPFSDSGYYLRAVAYDRGGFPKKAIDDYITAIELFGNKEKIGSASYYGMARNYEKLGQFCDAILPIETWVALNPARNDTSQTRAVVAAYVAKGNAKLRRPPARRFSRSRDQATWSRCRSRSTESGASYARFRPTMSPSSSSLMARAHSVRASMGCLE